jgi:hypothetical protein
MQQSESPRGDTSREAPALFDRIARALRIQGAAALALLVVLVLVDAWAISATDPDFYLPDLFRPVTLGVIVLFALVGLVRRDGARRLVRAVLLLVIVAVLFLEVRLRYRAQDDEGVEKTADVLLRYRYRPGNTFESNSDRRINQFGLMDEEHAIPKPSAVLRVVVISGSIANDGSIPFEKRFWKRLEAKLTDGRTDGKRVEVINVSVHGYSEVQQVRLLERVGLQYQPDVVVAAYMLSAASLQNGGYRRFGNSFFLFRFLPATKKALTGSVCSLFAPFHDEFSFDLIVRNSFERLALLSRLHSFKAIVAVLPVVERFDDPVCARLYDKVVTVAGESGLPAVRVPDAFSGEPFERFAKPGERWDVCHPNPDGHERIATSIAAAVRPLLAQPPQTAP